MNTAIESLENRIAPAILLNPRTVLFRDPDGRLAELHISETLFTAATINRVLEFSAGSVDTTTTAPQQLELVDFTGLAPRGALSLSLFVLPHSAPRGAQSFVDLGYINASGVNFHSIRIHGDLGGIVAGSGAGNAVAIGRLSVESMGSLGLASQAAGGTLDSSIDGTMRLLAARSDLNSVTIDISGNLHAMRIGGNLLGGDGAQSGAVEVLESLGVCAVGGSIEGGAGAGSGTILAQDFRLAKIGGSIVGGVGNSSGSLLANAAIRRVLVAGDLRGGAGGLSGSILADGDLGSAVLGGSLAGGAGTDSGTIESFGNFGRLRLGHDLDGGSGVASGEIVGAGNRIGSLVLRGSINGGAGSFSGFIQDLGNAGRIRVQGGLTGAAADSALIEIGGRADALRIGGSILGGAGAGSGEFFVQGDLGSAAIGGSLTGGSGATSGLLELGGNAARVSVAGSVLGGSGSASGAIFCTGNLSSLKILGDLQGGSVSGAASSSDTGYLQAANFGALRIGGSILAGENSGSGTLSASGSIRALGQIGALHVAGSLLGNDSEAVVIAAQGAALNAASRRDLAVARIEIGGGVLFSEILAGYSPALQPADGHAQIGSVRVHGDWIASSLVAGLESGPSEGFGTPADTVIPNTIPGLSILSRIARVVITGEILGNPAGGAHYGFEAEEIGAFMIGGHAFPAALLTAGAELSPTGGVTVQEITA